MPEKRIAFIRMWPNLPISKSIAQLLIRHFPGYEVDILDVDKVVNDHLDVSLANPFFVLKHYGMDILSGVRKYKASYLRTPYFFRKSRQIILDWLSQKDYCFSFQLQSLIDASAPGLPHFVYTDHTHLANLDYPDFDRRQLPSKDLIKLEKTIYQNATLIFTRSRNITRSLITQYQCEPDKVICVYAGSNVPILENNLNAARYERKNILFVGKDWERKGGPQLIEAFKMVLKTHPDACLTIVGCFPRVDVPNCKVVGPVPLEKVNQYYMDASVFCLPTRLEPFGIVIVEAQSYKLPVVATKIGAIPDFIIDQHNGYLVKPNDVESLAKSLNDLVSDPEKCHMFGENGYRLMKERYNWDKVGLQMRYHILPYLSGNGV
jgi:glycosyltransferase involved in cell wall biosynthesis